MKIDLTEARVQVNYTFIENCRLNLLFSKAYRKKHIYIYIVDAMIFRMNNAITFNTSKDIFCVRTPCKLCVS